MSAQEPTAAETSKAARNAVTVKMDDGRHVEFVGKRKMIKTPEKNAAGRTSIRLDFLNGETRLYTPDAAHREVLLERFAVHGMEQKLGDAIAGLDKVDDCVMSIDTLMDQLKKGQWTQKKEGGNSMVGSSILATALMEFSKKTKEEVRAFLLNKSQAEKVALRANAGIKPIIERLEAKANEGKKDKVDTDALLGSLAAVGTEARRSEGHQAVHAAETAGHAPTSLKPKAVKAA